jgi:hypothetical protein
MFSGIRNFLLHSLINNLIPLSLLLFLSNIAIGDSLLSAGLNLRAFSDHNYADIFKAENMPTPNNL